MIVWIVTMTAVYDHGCCGVFSSQDAAVSHAESLLARSDGHHDFVVKPFTVDVGVDVGRLGIPPPREGFGQVRVEP